MRFLHLNTHPIGATFSTTKTFHQYLLRQGNESIVVTARGSKDQKDYIPIATSGLRGIGISRATRKLFFSPCFVASSPYYFYPEWNLDMFSTEDILGKVPFKPDAFILYWTRFFLTPRIISELSKLTNAVFFWFLMDMAPFTGGCNYSFGCQAYKHSCGNCPALKSKNSYDFSWRLLRKKEKFFQEINLEIIAPTTTLFKQASESLLFRNLRIHQVILGIDSNLFKPGDKKLARTKLGLPQDKTILFFGAQKLSDKRKGISYLKESLTRVADQISPTQKERILLVYAGNADKFERDLPFQSQYLGLLNQEMLIQTYQAANLFLCPSIEDSGPAMINESLMCGTPVVSFDMGVAPDLVFSNITGYKAKLKNIEDFAFGILEFLNNSQINLDNISKKCRNLALEKSEMNKQFQLLADIIAKTQPIEAKS